MEGKISRGRPVAYGVLVLSQRISKMTQVPLPEISRDKYATFNYKDANKERIIIVTIVHRCYKQSFKKNISAHNVSCVK